jgi:hypothetical protein
VRPAVSTDQWAIVAAVVTTLIAILAWLRPRPPRRRKVPSLDGPLGASTRNAEFLDFLQRHEHRRIRLDVWLEDAAASVESGSHLLAARSFMLRLEGAHGERLGELHEIFILVDDVKDSQLTYAHRTWRLRGYFVASGIAGIWQGVIVHNLTPIPLAAVAE